MKNSLRISGKDLSAFNKHWCWFLIWGFALIALGIAAICTTTLTTIISVLLLGAIAFASGVVVIINTFTFWWRKWSGFILHLFMGLLYLAVGIMLINSPVISSLSLTLILGVLYILLGVFRLIYSVSLRAPRWRWSFFNGMLTLLLGILIMSQWPASGFYIIGLFVGIDLVFCGLAYVTAALAARVH